jgi:hypothetical protein
MRIFIGLVSLRLYPEPNLWLPNSDTSWSMRKLHAIMCGLHTLRRLPFVHCCVKRLFILTDLQDQVEPPMLVALALPHLPPNISSIIRHGLKYGKMLGALLDDLAAVIFAFAICVVIGSYLE